MRKSNILDNSIIFSKGKEIKNNYFTGTAWLKMLVPNNDIFNCSIGNVTFEPGSRNNWHKHPGGQILLITGGTGYYQEENQPVKILHEEDVISIKPNIKH